MIKNFKVRFVAEINMYQLELDLKIIIFVWRKTLLSVYKLFKSVEVSITITPAAVYLYDIVWLASECRACYEVYFVHELSAT